MPRTVPSFLRLVLPQGCKPSTQSPRAVLVCRPKIHTLGSGCSNYARLGEQVTVLHTHAPHGRNGTMQPLADLGAIPPSEKTPGPRDVCSSTSMSQASSWQGDCFYTQSMSGRNWSQGHPSPFPFSIPIPLSFSPSWPLLQKPKCSFFGSQDCSHINFCQVNLLSPLDHGING